MSSIKVEIALKQIGKQMQNARKRRGITAALMAEKLGVSRNTWSNLERGSPGVRLEVFAGALMIFDRLDELTKMLGTDPLGMVLMDEKLPQRVRNTSLSGAIKISLVDSAKMEPPRKEGKDVSD